MLKSQIIILVIAIIAVIFLFTLPKFIVKDNRTTDNKGNIEVATAPVDENVHEMEMSDNDRKKLSELRKSFGSVSDKEKKLKFADSLAVFYKKISQFDSSAKYRGEIAEINSATLNLVGAGEAYFDAATFAIDQKKSKDLGLKARSYFEEAYRKEPANLDLKAKIAKTYAVAPDSVNRMKHITMLREVLEKDPQNKEALMNLGKFSIQVSRFDNAAEKFEALLKLEPGNAEAEFYLGYCYMMSGDKGKARTAFENARKKSPDPDLQKSADEYLKELNK